MGCGGPRLQKVVCDRDEAYAFMANAVHSGGATTGGGTVGAEQAPGDSKARVVQVSIIRGDWGLEAKGWVPGAVW